MKSFNLIKPIFFILAIFIILVGCDKKVLNPIENINNGGNYFFLTPNDSNKFSYKLGDTIIFHKYKSSSNEKLVFMLNTINLDTFYRKHYFNDYKFWFNNYEECFHFNFINITNDSLHLDLYQLGEKSTSYHSDVLYITFNKTLYKAYYKPSYDTLKINNHNYYDVLTALSGETGDIPKNSHILINYNEGIFRIRTSNDEIWDLGK